MLKVEHGDAGATVTVAGEITNELVLEVCDSLNEAFNTYNWSQVELKIASSGGSLHALHYFVDAMVNYRALAATITTRALSRAASAVAVRVSLGVWVNDCPSQAVDGSRSHPRANAYRTGGVRTRRTLRQRWIAQARPRERGAVTDRTRRRVPGARARGVDGRIGPRR